MPRTTKPITPRIVQSQQNERLKALRYALQHGGRSRKDIEGNTLVGIEGENLVLEARRSGIKIATLFATPEALERLDPGVQAQADEILVVDAALLASAVSTEAPQPIAALVEPPVWQDSVLTHSTPLVVISSGLQDPGNLGTLIRSAEAFGASALVSLPGTVSEWNPKCVRASAGSVFRLPIFSRSEEDTFALLKQNKIPVLAAAGDGRDVQEYRLDEPVALVIGNEGNGIRAELIAKCDGRISIACPGPVESLNAATAASILLYEASRVRSKNPRAHKGITR